MDNQERVNRRRHRNLPAELKVEIVDCLPVENAVHFLANVPNRLIIHHCAPRVRRILKMIGLISADYVRILPAASSDGIIHLKNGHQYTPEMDIFIRYGAAHCYRFWISARPSDGFVGYPPDFFDNLIRYCYETKVPARAVHQLYFSMSLENPARWPPALIQPQVGEMELEELEVDNSEKGVTYILRNKHNRNIKFELVIYFVGGGQIYQKMTHLFLFVHLEGRE